MRDNEPFLPLSNPDAAKKTLHLRPGSTPRKRHYDVKSDAAPKPRPQRQEPRKPAPRPVAKLKGYDHQDELQAATGKNIILFGANAGTQPMTCKLLEADRYALKILVEPEGEAPTTVLMFKHAIASIVLLPEGI